MVGMGKQRGQLQLEAAICFACFLALLGVGMQALAGIGERGSEAMDMVSAKGSALACSTVIDSMYSNGVEQLAGYEARCTVAGEREVVGKEGGSEKRAFFLPERVRVLQAGEKTIVSVELNGHYR